MALFSTYGICPTSSFYCPTQGSTFLAGEALAFFSSNRPPFYYPMRIWIEVLLFTLFNRIVVLLLMILPSIILLLTFSFSLQSVLFPSSVVRTATDGSRPRFQKPFFIRSAYFPSRHLSTIFRVRSFSYGRMSGLRAFARTSLRWFFRCR